MMPLRRCSPLWDCPIRRHYDFGGWRPAFCLPAGTCLGIHPGMGFHQKGMLSPPRCWGRGGGWGGPVVWSGLYPRDHVACRDLVSQPHTSGLFGAASSPQPVLGGQRPDLGQAAWGCAQPGHTWKGRAHGAAGLSRRPIPLQLRSV